MQTNWHLDFFRDVALDFWRGAIPAEMTQAEADFLERTLEVGPSARLLDVPCGNGRHAALLAARGHQLTGVDGSAEFIEEARATVSPARWVLGDMCQLPWTTEFDGAYCFGNSFGYLDRAAARRFLAAVAGTLKPGARFIVETGMAAESILPTLLNKRWHHIGGIFVLSENRYHPAEGRLDIDYTFIRDGVAETRPSSSFVFTVAELCHLHREAGLEPVQLLGSIEGASFTLGSPRLILVSVRS
jgi:SAM-dependent methyltransferase